MEYGGGGSIKIDESVEGLVPYRKVMAKISIAKIKLYNDKYIYRVFVFVLNVPPLGTRKHSILQ